LISLGGYMGQTFGPIEGGSIGLSIGNYGSMGWAVYLCLLCLVLLLINILVLKSFRYCTYYLGIAIILQRKLNSTEMYWVILQQVVLYAMLLR
jgi:NHS family xanthosine MFS transporter